MKTVHAKPRVEVQPYRVLANGPEHPTRKYVTFPRISNYYRANGAAKRLAARLRRKGYPCRVHGWGVMVDGAPNDVIQRA